MIVEQRKQKRRPGWHAWFPLLGLLLFGGLLLTADRQRILEILGQAAPMPLVAGVLLYVLVYVLKTVRWLVCLSLQGIPAPYGGSLAAYTAGAAVGSVTPGRIGELIRWSFLRARGAGAARAAAGVLLDRILDVAITLLAAAVLVAGAFGLGLGAGNESEWVPAGWSLGGLPGALLAILAALGVVGAAFLLLWLGQRRLARRPGDCGGEPVERVGSGQARRASGGLGRMGRLLPAWVRERLPAEAWAEFTDGLLVLRGRWLWFTIALSLLIWGLNLAVSYSIFRAVGPQPPVAQFALAYGLAGVASYLPISISGLGSRELIFIGLMAPLGVPREVILSYGILEVAFVTLLTGLLAAAFALLAGGVNRTAQLVGDLLRSRWSRSRPIRDGRERD
ncbi:MAG: flippase-like domain-containing protein [Candidatus Eisenbacteria sp.]|nr:flippase-like domain-containing protein [Candidatus Eisenbacteria bacterium]